jgi:hypothetical protein
MKNELLRIYRLRINESLQIYETGLIKLPFGELPATKIVKLLFASLFV